VKKVSEIDNTILKDVVGGTSFDQRRPKAPWCAEISVQYRLPNLQGSTSEVRCILRPTQAAQNVKLTCARKQDQLACAVSRARDSAAMPSVNMSSPAKSLSCTPYPEHLPPPQISSTRRSVPYTTFGAVSLSKWQPLTPRNCGLS
jgi:hypothetical protein